MPTATITIQGQGRRLAVGIWAACALVAVLVTINGGLPELLGYGMFPGAVAALTWAVLWRPTVLLRPDDVEIVGVWRTVTIPYPLVEEVSTRWGLRVRAAGRGYGASAVAPRSRYRQDPLLGRGSPRPVEPDLLGASRDLEVSADAEKVGRVIEVRSQQASERAADRRRDGGRDDSDGLPVLVRWRVNGLEVAVVLVAVAAALLLHAAFGPG